MSENGISVIENLGNQVNLQTLDLASNRISAIDNVRHMSNLEELWVSLFIFIYHKTSPLALIIKKIKRVGVGDAPRV